MQTVTGIDLFANVVRHELRHVQQVADADPLLGALNGEAGSIWASGWSWNYSPNNHWTLGPDGQPGEAGVDDDADTHTDQRDNMGEVGFPGRDDVDLDTDDNNVPDAWGAVTLEGQADAQETVPQGTHAASDWGNPGKRHLTDGTAVVDGSND